MPVFKALWTDGRQTDPLVSPHLWWARQKQERQTYCREEAGCHKGDGFWEISSVEAEDRVHQEDEVTEGQ